jgi:clan AA aspartic protease (TIGR02281 family)
VRSKLFPSIVLIVSCCLVDEALSEEIFRWVDDKGTINFTDTPRSPLPRARDDGSKRPIKPFEETAFGARLSRVEQAPNLQKFIIPLRREAGRVLVEGNINDRASVPFVIDTGANMTILPAAVASRLGINSNGALLIEVRGVGGAVDGRLIEIASLNVGGAEARNVEVVVVNDDLRGVGLLGTDFLSRFRLDIDYTREQMVLQPSASPYGGYPAVWWQAKFGLYNRLKRSYQERIKQNADYLKTLAITPAQRNWEQPPSAKVNSFRPMADEIKEYEHYLRVLDQKMTELQLRANRAELPRQLWE